MQMEMGMGGAVNGITNSILTNNDNLSICGLFIVHEKNEPIHLGITRKPSCERSPNSEGVLYHTIISHGLLDFNGQNSHSIDLLLL